MRRAASKDPVSNFSGDIGPVNYPSYLDSICNSQGDFLCNPANSNGQTAMNSSEASNVSQILNKLRSQDESLVVCGQSLQDPVDRWHYQPFYLGVAILPDWSSKPTDSATLDSLGQLILADWNMDSLYVGEPRPARMCLNEAMLFVVPSKGEVYLASPSCDFICGSYGAPQAVLAANRALRSSGSVYESVVAGTNEVYAHLARVRDSRMASTKTETEDTPSANVTTVMGVAVNGTVLSILEEALFGLAVATLAGVSALVIWQLIKMMLGLGAKRL